MEQVTTSAIRTPLTKDEIKLKKLHDKVCQTCDGCSKSRCAFSEGYRRGVNEASRDMTMENELVRILMGQCGQRGDDEGAVQTLHRIIYERDVLLKNAIKEKLFKLV